MKHLNRLRAGFLAALSGALLIFCFPGWNFGWVAWGALVPLLISLRGASGWEAFRRGWLALFVAGVGTLYWIYPTCRAGGVNVPTSLLALAALAGYCALYGGAFAWAARRFEPLPGYFRPFALAAAWVALEFLRTYLLTGYPWLLLAYSQWNHPFVLPLAGVGGAYAVSFLIVLANGVLVEVLRSPARRATVFPGLVLMGALLLGAGLRSAPTKENKGPSAGGTVLKVAVVQGNIDQYKKWDQAYEDEIVETFSRLTREAAKEPSDLIIWPETSVPGWFPNDPRWVKWVGGLANEVKTPLLVGAVTRDGGDYNAAFLVDPSDGIVARYRKRHLVPFGEFVPFERLFGSWIPALGAMGDFDASDDETVFRISSGMFSANICFESLFPDLVRRSVRAGGGFTVNMTNDGWFLGTSAAEQHFAAAVFRAVENRAWEVSATNTGVSAFIDPSGRVTCRLERGRVGILRGEVVPDSRGTIYTRFGDVFAWGCAGLIFVTCMLLFVKETLMAQS